MNRRVITLAVCLLVLGASASVLAREKNARPGPLTGTWECTAHGGSHDGMTFSLTLEQEGETVTGSVSSPIGSTEFSSGSFKKNLLELHIDSDQGNYVLTAKHKGGELSGEWTHGDDKGTWDGKKQPEANK